MILHFPLTFNGVQVTKATYSYTGALPAGGILTFNASIEETPDDVRYRRREIWNGVLSPRTRADSVSMWVCGFNDGGRGCAGPTMVPLDRPLFTPGSPDKKAWERDHK